VKFHLTFSTYDDTAERSVIYYSCIVDAKDEHAALAWGRAHVLAALELGDDDDAMPDQTIVVAQPLEDFICAREHAARQLATHTNPEAVAVSPVDSLSALKLVQQALANYRDGVDTLLTLDGHGPITTLEEIKYLVVDPACGNDDG
jgi:hypothetical protein